MLISFRYPNNIIISNYLHLILWTIPWFLWFHQIIFAGFEINNYLSLNNKTVFLSALLSTCLIIIIFPFSQFHIPSLNQIKPNPILAENTTMISSTEGTLLLITKTNELFAQKDTKALWIGKQNATFKNIVTNNIIATVSKAEILNNLGYIEKEGSADISLYIPPFQYPYIKGQEIFDLWQKSIKQFNSLILKAYTKNNISIIVMSNHQLILNRDLPKTINRQDDSAIPHKKESLEIDSYNSNNIEGLLVLFIHIFNLMLSATMFGLLTTLKQSLFGTFGLVGVISLLFPICYSLLSFFIVWTKFPMISELIIFGILSVVTSIIVLIKRINEEKKYAQNY
ncbi:MAG: hypothetical protein ACRCVW_01840 [Brevinema sp.]